MQNEKLLNYNYRVQYDNKNKPGTTCNVTGLANWLSCLAVEVDEDELYKKSNTSEMKEWAAKYVGAWSKNYADRNDLNQIWAVLQKLANEALAGNGKAVFKDNYFTARDIADYIDKGSPVLVGGNFTHGGHIVCIVGYNSLGYLVADSWGNWTTGYKDRDGESVMYPYEATNKILHGKDGKYRGMVFEKA